MKKIMCEVFFGNSPSISLVLVFGLMVSISLGCKFGTQSSSDDDSTISKTTKSVDSKRDSSKDDSSDSEDSKSASAEESDAQDSIKVTMNDFADAVEKGDFEDFYSNTSKDFQNAYKPEQLNSTFGIFIDKKDQALPILRQVDDKSAVFNEPPRIRTERGVKVLVANGYFSTTPNKVQFETEYEQQDGEWKLLKLKVKI